MGADQLPRRRTKMNRALLMACAVVTTCFSSSSLLAAVSNYRFIQTDASPYPFVYDGGDLVIVSIAAQLSGQISISTDENTGAAELRFDNVVIHSAYSLNQNLPSDVPENWNAGFYEGKMLPELDAFDFSISGQRISAMQITFGPTMAQGPDWYRQTFDFTVDADSYRLSGVSWHGDDSPNYYIDGRLLLVPEPSVLGSLITALAFLANRRHSR
jgi:hypothetical protein